MLIPCPPEWTPDPSWLKTHCTGGGGDKGPPGAPTETDGEGVRKKAERMTMKKMKKMKEKEWKERKEGGIRASSRRGLRRRRTGQEMGAHQSNPTGRRGRRGEGGTAGTGRGGGGGAKRGGVGGGVVEEEEEEGEGGGK